jgi:tyrosine-protein phosphatase SIW14
MPPIHSPRRTVLAPVVLALLLASPMAAEQAVRLPAIDNFGKVTESYYRGAQPKGHDFADLKELGVKLVIDLAQEGDSGEAANVEAAGMKFVRIPLTTAVTPDSAVIDHFLALVTDAGNLPVYVHCIGGRHRTGALTAVYRMSQEGWTAARAFSEMKQYRFGADFLHPELKKFVYSYVPNRGKGLTAAGG